MSSFQYSRTITLSSNSIEACVALPESKVAYHAHPNLLIMASDSREEARVSTTQGGEFAQLSSMLLNPLTGDLTCVWYMKPATLVDLRTQAQRRFGGSIWGLPVAQAWSPDGKTLAVATDVPGRIHFVRTGFFTGHRTIEVPRFAPIHGVGWIANDVVGVLTENELFHVRRRGPSSHLSICAVPPHYPRVAFANRGSRAVACLLEKQRDLFIINIESGEVNRCAPLGAEPIAISFSPDDGLMAYLTRQGDLRILETKGWTSLSSMKMLTPVEDASISFSPDNKTIALLSTAQHGRPSIDILTSQPSNEPSRDSRKGGYVMRPRLFIGSSVEGLTIAERIQSLMQHVVDSTIWSQGVFGLSGGTLETLVTSLENFDYAALVLTPDDMIEKRGVSAQAPRDNVLFELGLFMGRLGPKKTFIVYCRDKKIVLPSDLAGVTAATFADRPATEMNAALGPVCRQIKDAMGLHDR